MADLVRSNHGYFKWPIWCAGTMGSLNGRLCALVPWVVSMADLVRKYHGYFKWPIWRARTMRSLNGRFGAIVPLVF
jgi:hypothetical protein